MSVEHDKANENLRREDTKGGGWIIHAQIVISKADYTMVVIRIIFSETIIKKEILITFKKRLKIHKKHICLHW